MPQKPKVLFIIPSVSSGGIETFLMRFLKTKGVYLNSTILVRTFDRGNLWTEYKALGVPLVFMPLGHLNLFRSWKYFRFFKRNNFDVVCDFNANFAGIPLWIAKLAGIKKRVAFYRQGSDHFKPNLLRNSYNKLVKYLVYRNANKILANSKVGIDYFFPNRKADDPRFKIINNGIEIDQYQKKINIAELRLSLGIPPNAFVIGHTGRFDKAKNHQTIIKVAEMLIKEDSDVYLVLIGPAPKDLDEAIRTPGISKNIRVLGYRADIPSLLQIFDVFYFPSITEGQPNALIEAMAAGIPVVASNIGPIWEILPDYTGLVDPFDTQNAIQLIREIRKNPDNSPHNIVYKGILNKFDAKSRFNDFLKELTISC
jgi:glycosyltransferase involved in cell wall biosynthesis